MINILREKLQVFDFARQILHIVLHVEQYLQVLISWGGAYFYLVLFLIIFCETALVICFFLPGDSLLFASGALTAASSLNIHGLALCLSSAAILGYSLNYAIGCHWGPKAFKVSHKRWLKPKHLEYTHQFFQRYGAKTIVIARFIPIVRSVAPFVAGVAGMPYSRFSQFNILGALLWINSLLYISYYFANIPLIKNNFSFVLLTIIVLSLLPPMIEFIRHKIR